MSLVRTPGQPTAGLSGPFLELYRQIRGPYRYSEPKFGFLIRNFGLVKKLVEGADLALPPSFVEIHPEERCNLNCVFCRGQLREVPEQQVSLPTNQFLQLIEDIHRMNPLAFIRVSGTIGEPLLHPGIQQAFDRMERLGLGWGLTTNGLLLDRPGMIDVLAGSATFLHVSLDAGSDETYRQIKAGRPGDFERVLCNLGLVAKRIAATPSSKLDLVVSVLLQTENWRELPGLAGRLKAIGVHTLEIKMQHFDERRVMDSAAVQDAYAGIDHTRRSLEDESFRVVVVQGRGEALVQILDVPALDFESCYSGRLGLSATVDARGNVNTCCHYFQDSLGTQGHISEGFPAVWAGLRRRQVLRGDPRRGCRGCAPSDLATNRFVAFLKQAHEMDLEFLETAREIVAGPGRPQAG